MVLPPTGVSILSDDDPIGYIGRGVAREWEFRMRILMLGWEFPPFIAGGLGTACYGLTRALDRLGHEVLFVLPRAVDRSKSSHIRLISPSGPVRIATGSSARPHGPGESSGSDTASIDPDDAGSQIAPFDEPPSWHSINGFEHALFNAVPASRSSPYPAFGSTAPGSKAVRIGPSGEVEHASESGVEAAPLPEAPHSVVLGPLGGGSSAAGPGYGSDVVGDSERYARLVYAMCRNERFDVIHAHDWMTFPAGLALAQRVGKPLVVHVHSTEFDRSGEHINQRVYDIERRGMHGALRVIAVSEMTKSICAHRYGVDGRKIDVVYNGIDSETAQPHSADRLTSKDKIVLFLGRITMQKGPEYFIRAAKRVLEKVPEAKFVVAGSGDMAVRMIEEAAHLGIGHRVLFTGFLRGPQVDRIFRMADCYVMPSVSEPFGIAPLEAMRNDVPAIISKQSGVSEVLTHVLKVDFWDIDEMANKIVAVLRHPPLSQTLREHGSFELRKLTWDGAATKCVQSYGAAIGGSAVGAAQ
ncbi:MAG: glycosyltransferase [Phycisphaeraceae bacterium]|nr:glycosyltransferase [Phycisphaeraceae bacterium]